MTSLGEHFFINGASHLWGAKALLEFSQDYANEHDDITDKDHFVFNGRYSQSLNLLLAFAAELLLKAVLAECGALEDELKKLGHDLDALLDAVGQTEIEIVDADFRRVINLHSDPHKLFEFRYGKERQLDIPSPEPAIALLEQFAFEIQEHFGFVKPNS